MWQLGVDHQLTAGQQLVMADQLLVMEYALSVGSAYWQHTLSNKKQSTLTVYIYVTRTQICNTKYIFIYLLTDPAGVAGAVQQTPL